MYIKCYAMNSCASIYMWMMMMRLSCRNCSACLLLGSNILECTMKVVLKFYVFTAVKIHEDGGGMLLQNNDNHVSDSSMVSLPSWGGGSKKFVKNKSI